NEFPTISQFTSLPQFAVYTVIELQILEYPYHSNCRKDVQFGECLSSCILLKSGKTLIVENYHRNVEINLSNTFRSSNHLGMLEQCGEVCKQARPCFEEIHPLEIVDNTQQDPYF